MVCGKTIYKTQQEAIGAISGIAVDNSVRRGKVRPTKSYWCDQCLGYHITSMYAKKSGLVDKHNTKQVSTLDDKKRRNIVNSGGNVVVHLRNFVIK